MLSLYYYRFHIHVKLINIIIGSTNKLKKFAPWTNLHWSPSLGFVHFFLLWKYHCSGNLKIFIGCFGLDLLWALLQSLQNDQNHLRQCTEDESYDGANRHPERCSFWWKCWGIFSSFFGSHFSWWGITGSCSTIIGSGWCRFKKATLSRAISIKHNGTFFQWI